MGLDQSTSQEKLLLTKSGEELIIKQYKKKNIDKNEDNTIETIPDDSYIFRINTLYTLLQEDQLNGSHNGFRSSLDKIVTLDLSNCDLVDLPKCLKILRLKTLNLSNNKLKQVPSCLYGSGLQKLENLNLSFNQISIFDIEPDCINNLKRLNLNHNNFENVPVWFLKFRCTNLEEFSYSENKALNYNFLKNSVNRTLMKIRHLEFKNSCLLDRDFALFRTFRCLEYLDISNEVTNTDPRYINKLRNLEKLFSKLTWIELRVLKLDNLGISILPENLLWLESIVELHLSYNVISWIPEGFGYLANLEVLDISYNELVAIPVEFVFLTNLKVLKAAGNHLEDFPRLPGSLVVLDLYDNYIDNTEHLDLDSANLKYVDLEYNYCDMDEYTDQKKYTQKRDNFRNYNNYTNRNLGPKNQPSPTGSALSYTYESYKDDSDFEIDEDNPPNFDLIPRCSPQEDWDSEILQEINSENRHPDITLSDNEWEGDQLSYISKNYLPKQSYPSEEDWIFADAD